MNEIWKPVVGYEGLYEVSNLGRVKALERVVKFGLVSRYTRPEHLIKGFLRQDGYIAIGLSRDGGTIHFPAHRLVAMAFIPNPNNYPIINHKNEIRNDNRVENLEWCTQSYNLAYNGNRAKKGRARMRPIIQMDLEGNEIARFNGGIEAERILGFSRKGISRAICGTAKTAYGYKWKRG